MPNFAVKTQLRMVLRQLRTMLCFCTALPVLVEKLSHPRTLSTCLAAVVRGASHHSNSEEQSKSSLKAKDSWSWHRQCWQASDFKTVVMQASFMGSLFPKGTLVV